MSLLLLALASFLSFLFTARLEIVLFPYLLHVIVEFFLSDFQRLAQVLKNFGMIILLCPIGGVEAVAVTDCWFHSGGYK